ncbi:uncharacterized protein LOC143286183 [Babylonia areolata]|uniref:uncharacterized protein LOC143286183 n=1 Tax=Babylonia areolata TaxID=304850 RepID=UPI003FD366BC
MAGQVFDREQVQGPAILNDTAQVSTYKLDMDGQVQGHVLLYGTAQPQLRHRGERNSVPPAHADQSKNINKIHREHSRRGRLRWKQFLKRCCFPCLCKTSETPQAAVRCTQNHEKADKFIQDHEKDAYFTNLISRTGRSECYKYQVSESAINVSVGNPFEDEPIHVAEQGGENEMSRKVPCNNMTSADNCLPQTEETAPPVDYSDSAHAEAPGKAVGQAVSKQMTSEKQVTKSSEDNDSSADTQKKSTETDPQNIGGSFTEDIKNAIRALSDELSQPQGHGHRLPPGSSVIEKAHLRLLKLRLQPKDFLSLRYPPPYQQRPVIMMNPSDCCYPRYSDTDARRNTLKKCTDLQLSGYGQEELAQAGWFFNSRVLTTFCCGMEMPVTPVGHPHNVHLGLSPHCQVALSLQSSATQSSEQAEGDAQASNSGIHFSIPVQATDEGPSQLHVVDSFGVYTLSLQESTPGGQWTMERVVVSRRQAEDQAYLQNVVTNSTQLTPEPRQPSVENHQPPAAPQRPGDSAQNPQSGEGNEGQLMMRGNAPNPLRATHNHRIGGTMEIPGWEPPPTDYAPAFDQLNIGADGLTDHEPRYRHFGFPSLRVGTFRGWPSNHSPSPNSLSDAGFFYGGYGDSVLCYTCGIGLRFWQSEDDPWIEHARIQPSCFFVKSVQGQHFIDVAREMRRNNQHPTYREVRLEANRRRAAAQGGDAGAVLSDDDPGVDLLCKVCYDRERTVMLMPCRHLAVCQPCGQILQSCPVCHSGVESTLQTSLG